jgi:hypothetical protein
VVLITSGAYVSSSLVAEFGRIPSCMLPLQSKRLYQHQIELFKDESIFISLPIDYELSEYDRKNLKDLHIEAIYVPIGISLGESIVYSLNTIGRYTERLKILHGDTLVDTIPNDSDCCLCSSAEDDYSWVYLSDNDDVVYVGYYAFSDQKLLIRKIIESGYHFEEGVSAYTNTVEMKYISTCGWLDFGLISSYYRSKTKFTTQRHFNRLRITKYSVTKFSKQVKKILAEVNWFNSIPSSMKKYTPSIWNYGISSERNGYYEIEYFYLSSLAELFVFGNISLHSWKKILDACSEYIEQATNIEIPDRMKIMDGINLSYQQKTIERLETLDLNIEINHDWIINGKKIPSIADILNIINNDIYSISHYDIGIMHGDFCFSNILYNYISQSIKVIDPRGLDFNGNQIIYGDIRYDIAKLAHSILGLYDFIISGNYFLEEIEPYCFSFKIYTGSIISSIQQYFRNMNFLNRTISELSVYPIMIHLFFSMLPLHKDSSIKQKALLANALRLYVEYQEIKV